MIQSICLAETCHERKLLKYTPHISNFELSSKWKFFKESKIQDLFFFWGGGGGGENEHKGGGGGVGGRIIITIIIIIIIMTLFIEEAQLDIYPIFPGVLIRNIHFYNIYKQNI